MEKTFLEAGFDRALVKLEISTNVPYPLTQNLDSDFVPYPNLLKTESKEFLWFFVKTGSRYGWRLKTNFLRPTSFGNNQNGFYRLNPFFGFRKTEPFSFL